ncbi:hypothetical protein JCM19235_1444 [Vibrio maritimus]|uniref:Uncharacterized protein n=1 Tax=Vibrio maritimus TaxID=990268 RepID=A0A090SQG2_9VIBR|nr:hypothetical protein JCM19235_1444 [Vibrio maritimus]
MITASKVHFCNQTWQLDSQIQLVNHHEEHCDVVVKDTPFHPVSHIWLITQQTGERYQQTLNRIQLQTV